MKNQNYKGCFILLLVFLCLLKFDASATDPSYKQDFDGDGKTDIAIYRSGNCNFPPFDQAYWWILSSQTGQVSSYPFGRSCDFMNAADYDGDGKADFSITRWVDDEGSEKIPTVMWFQFSSNGAYAVDYLNGFGVAANRNYLGDARAEPTRFETVWDRSDPDVENWYYCQGFQIKPWDAETPLFLIVIPCVYYGQPQTLAASPASGDYDNDGQSEPAVYVKDLQNSNNNHFRVWDSPSASSYQAFNFDVDSAAPGDYDGDGKTDFAGVKRINNNTDYLWRITKSSNSSLVEVGFGLVGDIPVPNDYDGDGKTDIAVFRPSNSTWYILRSSDGGVTYQVFGLSTDIPVSSLFVLQSI